MTTTNLEIHAALKIHDFKSQAAIDIMESQSIDSLEELKVLDDKEVEPLCKVVRKPRDATDTGGTVVSSRAQEITILQSFI